MSSWRFLAGLDWDGPDSKGTSSRIDHAKDSYNPGCGDNRSLRDRELLRGLLLGRFARYTDVVEDVHELVNDLVLVFERTGGKDEDSRWWREYLERTVGALARSRSDPEGIGSWVSFGKDGDASVLTQEVPKRLAANEVDASSATDASEPSEPGLDRPADTDLRAVSEPLPASSLSNSNSESGETVLKPASWPWKWRRQVWPKRDLASPSGEPSSESSQD